jgi:hypothetical protein
MAIRCGAFASPTKSGIRLAWFSVGKQIAPFSRGFVQGRGMKRLRILTTLEGGSEALSRAAARYIAEARILGIGLELLTLPGVLDQQPSRVRGI